MSVRAYDQHTATTGSVSIIWIFFRAVILMLRCVAVAARWYRQIGRWLEASDSNPVPFKPNKARVLPGGLAAVEDGLALLKAGKVHGEKLVYRIAETPQLQK